MQLRPVYIGFPQLPAYPVLLFAMYVAAVIHQHIVIVVNFGNAGVGVITGARKISYQAD